MKKIAFTLAVAALFTIGAGFAGARPTATHAPTPVTVVMHDPGCHWFSVAGKFTTKQTVVGSVKLTNFDEAPLVVKGHGTKIVKLGKSVVLGKGTYRITMVGQAPDDNHLKLLVK